MLDPPLHVSETLYLCSTTCKTLNYMYLRCSTTCKALNYMYPRPSATCIRRSLTKLRLSSHNLEIERGRHTKPVTPVIERLCIVCGVIDDELHFVTSCKKHTTERERLYSYVDSHVPNFCNLNNAERFIYLLTNENPSILLHLSKFVHRCFLKH